MRKKSMNGGEGRGTSADKAMLDAPSPPPNSDDGQTVRAGKAIDPLPSSLPNGGEGHSGFADKARTGPPSPPPDLEQIISMIRDAHRQRCYAMEQRKRADLSLLAFLRTVLGWSKALPEKERAAIGKQAMALVKFGETEAKGKDADTDEPAYVEWREIILASIAAREPFDFIENQAKLRMGKLARALPVYGWVEKARGFGDVSLAVIVAEAGDLANYATHSKLWKRMGVAVMGDVRQGGLAKNASKDAWIAHGYNRQRRSKLWNIGDALIKAQVRKVRSEDGEDEGERTSIGDYGAAYLSRKAYEMVRDPEMSKMHAHRRAQRYAEKKLLRDLWTAWRVERKAAGSVLETAILPLPSARRDEETANLLVPEMAAVDMPSPHHQAA
jgi:hypothetical protein